MRSVLLIGLGGGFGSILRYIIGSLISRAFPVTKFPLGTFLINLAGCLLIGVVVGWIERMDTYNQELRLLLVTGVLGGFTTFSAFGLETLSLLRSGQVVMAVCYSLSSVVLGVVFVFLGIRQSI